MELIGSFKLVPNEIKQTANTKGTGTARIKYEYFCNIKKTVDAIHVHDYKKLHDDRHFCLKYDNPPNYI